MLLGQLPPPPACSRVIILCTKLTSLGDGSGAHFLVPGCLGSGRRENNPHRTLLHLSIVSGTLLVLRRWTSVVAMSLGSELRLPGLKSGSITFVFNLVLLI